MKFETISAHLADVPFMPEHFARVIYDFILEHKPDQVLELGFAHGKSSNFIAAALHENGSGHLTTVDLVDNHRDPSITELLQKTGLGDYVTVVREQSSYTWFLKKQIESQTDGLTCTPLYDLCFIDGAKNWTIDGAAFFMVDKLLKSEGWILFDDLDYTYRYHEERTGKHVMDGINFRELGQDEVEQAHIDRVYQLLVMQHPDYSNFHTQFGSWAWAQKTPRGDRTSPFEA